MRVPLTLRKHWAKLSYLGAKRAWGTSLVYAFVLSSFCTVSLSEAQEPVRKSDRSHSPVQLRLFNAREVEAIDCKLPVDIFLSKFTTSGRENANPQGRLAAELPKIELRNNRELLTEKTQDNSAYFVDSVTQPKFELKGRDLLTPRALRPSATESILGIRRPEFQADISEQTALRADFRAAVLAGVANCPANSRFRLTLKDFLAERTGKDLKLSLGRAKILPLHKHIWEQFETTVGAVDHMIQGDPKDLLTILPGPRLEKSVAKALAADLISHLTETNEAFKTRLHFISRPLELQKLADELGKKLKGKNIRSLADLKKEAKTDAERSLVELLFGSGYGQSMADKLIGLDKANYLRNSVLLGAIKIQPPGAGYNLAGGNSIWPDRAPNQISKDYQQAVARMMGTSLGFSPTQELFENLKVDISRANPRERQETRQFLQETLQRMSRQGINPEPLESSTQTAVRAEQVRSSIINSIQSIDRSLPQRQNPTAYDLVDALPYETRTALGFAEGELRDSEGELLRRLNGIGPVTPSIRNPDGTPMTLEQMQERTSPRALEDYLKQPQAESLECNAMLCEILKVPDAKKEPAHSTEGLEGQRKSAAEQLQHAATKPIGRGHTYYGRALDSEYDLAPRRNIEDIAAAVAGIINLSFDERKRLAEIRPSALDLLREMVRTAQPREWMDKASGLRDEMVLSLEDWIPYILNPKGKEDEIFAIAALTRAGRPGSDSHILSFLGSQLAHANLAGLDTKLFGEIADKLTKKENPIELVEKLRKQVEAQIDSQGKQRISPSNADYLLLADIVLREWSQTPEAILVDKMNPELTAESLMRKYLPPQQQVLHADRRNLEKQLSEGAGVPEIRRAAEGQKWLREAFTRDGKGLPLPTELALTRLFSSSNSELPSLMRSVHGAMPTKDFHHAFAGTNANPDKAIEVLTQAINTYSPASHYLAADPKLVIERRFAESLRRMYDTGNIDESLMSEIEGEMKARLLAKSAILASCAMDENGSPRDAIERRQCLRAVMAEESALFGECFVNDDGDLLDSAGRTTCIRQSLARKASQIAYREKNPEKAKSILAKQFEGEALDAELKANKDASRQRELLARAGLIPSSWQEMDEQVVRPNEIDAELHHAQLTERTSWEKAVGDADFQWKKDKHDLEHTLERYGQELLKASKELDRLKQAKKTGDSVATDERLKEAQDHLAASKRRLGDYLNPARQKANALLAASESLNPTGIASGGALTEDDIYNVISGMLNDPELLPEINELLQNYNATGRMTRETPEGLKQYSVDDFVKMIEAFRSKHKVDGANKGPVSARLKAMKEACDKGETSCGFVCRDTDDEQTCKAKEAMRAQIDAVLADKNHDLDKQSVITDAEEGQARTSENRAIALALLRDLDRQTHVLMQQAAAQEVHDINQGRISDAFSNDPKLAQSELTQNQVLNQMAHGRQIVEWGRALADSVSSLNQGKDGIRLPDPGAADYHQQAREWVKKAGMNESLDQWVWLAKSGTLPLPPGADAESYFYDHLLKKSLNTQKSRVSRREQIEQELRGILTPTGTQHPNSELWDWSTARLSSIAPVAGPGVPQKWTDAELKKQGYRMTQDRLRELLDEYAKTMALPGLARNANYRALSLGNRELDTRIQTDLENQGIDAQAVALNGHTAVTPVDVRGEDGKVRQGYNFTNLEKLVPELTKKLESMRHWVERGGALHDRVMESGRWYEGAERVGRALGNGANRWNQVDTNLLYTENDREIMKMENELFNTLGTLSTLGTTNIEFHDPETGKKIPLQGRNIAAHLRDRYALNILPDKIASDNRTDAGYALTEEGIKLAAVMLATRGIGGMAGWAKALPAVQRFLALQRMQKVLNYGTKAYTIGQGFYARGKLAVAGAAWATGIGAVPAAYLHRTAILEAESVANQIDKDGNGVPDWKDAMDAGRPYKFHNQGGVADNGGLTSQQSLRFDRDDNGVPDSYEQFENPLRLTSTYVGPLDDWYQNTRNSSIMMMLNPLGQLVPKGVLGLAAKSKTLATVANHPNVRAWQPAVGQFVLTEGMEVWKAGSLKPLASWETHQNAAFGSLFMSPIDDIWANNFIRKTLGQANGKALTREAQDALQRGIYMRKAIVNHIVQDGGQGVWEWARNGGWEKLRKEGKWDGGVYTTKNGMKVTNPLYAFAASVAEGGYMSNQASRPNQAVLDLLPQLAELELLYKGQSPLLQLEVPVKDAKGNYTKKTLGQELAAKADLHRYIGTENGRNALLTLYRDHLTAMGDSDEQVLKDIGDGIAKLGLGEAYLTEAKDFITSVVETQKLRALADGRYTFAEMQAANTGPADPMRFGLSVIDRRVFGPPKVDDQGNPVQQTNPALTYHRLPVGGLVDPGTGAFRNGEVQKAVAQVALDYHLDPVKFEAMVLREFKNAGNNPYLTLGSLARRGK
jgi:hypothetical protein